MFFFFEINVFATVSEKYLRNQIKGGFKKTGNFLKYFLTEFYKYATGISGV